jgi:hypothetical protein
MKEELIKAIEEKRLTDFIIDSYGNMPTKTVRRLLILLAEYFRCECSTELIYDIERFYHEDFE